MRKNITMIIEIKEITPGNVNELLGKIGKSPKKTIARHFGKLKRGIDGMVYQKSIRNEWR
ncbi:MAG: hypothetical protein LBL07_05650 [Tannerella sp.]|nr:hypothetical protein [Tannerella sp.]